MLAMSENPVWPGAQFSFVAFARRWLVCPVVKAMVDELHRHGQRWFLELDVEEVP